MIKNFDIDSFILELMLYNSILMNYDMSLPIKILVQPFILMIKVNKLVLLLWNSKLFKIVCCILTWINLFS